MARTVEIELDDFARTLESMVSDYTSSIEEHLPEAIDDACKASIKSVREQAGLFEQQRLEPRYARSMTRKVSKEGAHEWGGEVGSKRYPGLVHLLEKGHATMNGGRTSSPAEGHFSRAFDEGSETYDESVMRILEREAGA